MPNVNYVKPVTETRTVQVSDEKFVLTLTRAEAEGLLRELGNIPIGDFYATYSALNRALQRNPAPPKPEEPEPPATGLDWDDVW